LAGWLISPAQEHYISNSIRQKLIAGIDRMNPQVIAVPKTYLFFLPNNEWHETGLLYTFYLTKANGHKCIYLGQSVPLENFVTISRSIEPDYLVSIFTSRMPDTECEDFLMGCEKGLTKSRFLVSGRLLLEVDEKMELPSDRFILYKDFPHFKRWI